MKKTIIILLTLLGLGLQANSQAKKELEPYIEFIKTQNTSAKDYVLSLFKEHDIVVLCERDHRELTQYNLYLDIIKDPYFVNNVGTIFTEVGGTDLNPELSKFLNNDNLTEKEIESQALDFQRDCLYHFWNKYNFYYFITHLHNINKNLPSGKKVQMYPSNLSQKFENATPDIIKDYLSLMFSTKRDSIMADNIITELEKMKQQTPGKKALVIMNYRHAYNQDMYVNNLKIVNTARFLFEKYPGKVANVYINTYLYNERGNLFNVLQDGKWDAAFKASNVENVGFNLNNTVFGNDNFDYWTAQNNFTYKDIFTGFVFYMPIDKFKMAMGIPHIMENGFYDEYRKREALLIDAFKKAFNVDRAPEDEKKIMRNNQLEINPDNLDVANTNINKWLN